MKKKNFFNTLFKFLIRQWKLDSFRFSLCSFFAFLILSILTYNIFNIYNENAIAQQIMNYPKMTFSDLKLDVEGGTVKSIQINTLSTGYFSKSIIPIQTVEFINGSIKSLNKFYEEKKINDLLEKHEYIQYKSGLKFGGENSLVSLAYTILNIAGFVLILILVQRAATDVLVGKNFKPPITNEDLSFDDIIGYDEVKLEFKEVVNQLQNKKKFKDKEITPPRGILLSGAPGVGKTMFAKALANEFNANFLFATGSDFVELYVGTGARRARTIFREARINPPCIIFIDEIDALGSRDQWGMDPERLSTINQLLSEMDGFTEQGQVLVVAATNHPEKLDPAMLRPGRFDKKIHIPNPDLETRIGILNKYLNNNIKEEINLKDIAFRINGASGADIKNLVAEAKNIALRNSNGTSSAVSTNDLISAHEITLMGYTVNNPSNDERKRVAYHELGHALVAHLKCPHLEVSKVSVGARGAALGFTMQIPIEEKNIHTQEELLAQIQTYLAGRAAEEIFLNSISTGAADDLERASALAIKMAATFGMGAIGLLSNKINPATGNYDQYILKDAANILDAQYKNAKELILKNKTWFDLKINHLLDNGSLVNKELFLSEDFVV